VGLFSSVLAIYSVSTWLRTGDSAQQKGMISVGDDCAAGYGFRLLTIRKSWLAKTITTFFSQWTVPSFVPMSGLFELASQGRERR
jgi:hypothetical protein